MNDKITINDIHLLISIEIHYATDIYKFWQLLQQTS